MPNLMESKECSIQVQDYTLTFSIYDDQISLLTLNMIGGHCLHTGYLFWYSTEDGERHCVYLRGYDPATNLLIGHNSWGAFRKLVYIEYNKHPRAV